MSDDPMTREQALAAVHAKKRKRGLYTEAQRKARRDAQSNAASDARVALTKMYPDDYRVLYEAACAVRLAELDGGAS